MLRFTQIVPTLLFYAATAGLLEPPVACAVSHVWSPQGGSSDWNDPSNWNPSGVPAPSADVSVSQAFPGPSLASGDSAPLGSLFILSGGRLSTGGKMLTVDNVAENAAAQVIGTGSTLIVDEGSPTGRDASIDVLELTVGAETRLAGGLLEIDRRLQVDSSSRITGNGLVRLNPASSGDVLINGALRPNGGRGMFVTAPEAATVLIGTDGVFATLDAGFGDLTIDADLDDQVNGVLTVGAGHAIRFDQPAGLSNSSVVNLRGSETSQATLSSDDTSVWGRVNVNGLSGMSGTQQLRELSEIHLTDPEDRLILRGGTVVMGEELSVTAPGAQFVGQGTVINEESSLLSLISSAKMDVEVVNSGTVDAATIAFIALLEVGQAEFRDFRQTATGTLNYDIGEINGSRVRDFYRADGTVHLDGLLRVELVDLVQGQIPTLEIGDSFPVMTAAGGVFGRFAETDLPKPPAGAAWEVNYFPEAVSIDLVAATGVPGDFNNDGLVDAADYTVWRDNVGQPSSTLPNDIDGGSVGPAQYATWRLNFGGGTMTSSLRQSVPEPAAACLLISALLQAAIRRTKTRLSVRRSRSRAEPVWR